MQIIYFLVLILGNEGIGIVGSEKEKKYITKGAFSLSLMWQRDSPCLRLPAQHSYLEPLIFFHGIREAWVERNLGALEAGLYQHKGNSELMESSRVMVRSELPKRCECEQ